MKIVSWNVNGINDEELDDEGRVITLEYEDFYIVNTYMLSKKYCKTKL